MAWPHLNKVPGCDLKNINSFNPYLDFGKGSLS